jgi:hypothetical protein
MKSLPYRWSGLPFATALFIQLLCFVSEDYCRDFWKVVSIPNDERLNGVICYFVLGMILFVSSLLLLEVRRLCTKCNARFRQIRRVAYTLCAAFLAVVATVAICFIPFFLELDSDGEWESVQSSSA